MDPTDRRHRTALIAAITGGLVLLALIGVGIYGLLRGPDAPSPPPSTTTTTTAPTPAIPGHTGPRPIVGFDGPEEFTVAVADALFTWDTTSGYSPADYAQELADVTTSIEADAAATDVRAYLPTPAGWAQLRSHQTRQWLTIDTITIPDGAVAYTITGTRHRVGTWNTEPVTTAHPVAFTVFLTCTVERTAAPPVGDGIDETCQLLRLSQLDNPLR